jgi:hypothetical protein
MTNHFLAMIGSLRAKAGRRVHAACIAVCLAAAGLSLAGQTMPQRTVVLKSGAFTILPGHKMNLIMTEVGDARALSRVRIEFRDAADNLVAELAGDLTTISPVRLQVTAPSDGRSRYWRALVVITSNTAVELSSPMTVMEDINPSTQSVNVLAQSGPTSKPVPSIPGSDPKMNCPDFEVTWIASPQ